MHADIVMLARVRLKERGEKEKTEPGVLGEERDWIDTLVKKTLGEEMLKREAEETVVEERGEKRTEARES